MSTGVLVTTAAGVVGLYTACFHGWVYAQHRPAREHLWVAMIGASVALVCFGAALLTERPDPAGALLALRLQMVGAVGVTLGLLRFGAARFRIEAPLLLRAADVVGAATATLSVLAPGLGAALLDCATAVGLTDLPLLLLTGGYPFLVASLSAVLTRDLVAAMGESERLGEHLQRLAHERADELRAVDLQLARGEQLAAIGTLAAGVAHEINNPLAYVSANLNHLHTLWEEKDVDGREVVEVLGECRDGLARVSAIASDLLRMARHGASEREAVDLSEVVRSVLPLVQRDAAGRVRIEADLAPAAQVLGSARLLGQVALNLIWNAIHAADHGDAARIEVTTRSAASAAELCVRDNGPGIPPALLEQVFEPSFTTRPLGEGTGLGLALVRLIVKHHGGEIQAESGASGTYVRVRLPARPAQADA